MSTSSAFFKTASQLNSTQPLSRISPICTINPSEHIELRNPVSNAVVSLAIETVAAGYGALVFCGGRQGCQSMAALISEAMPCDLDVDEGMLDKRKDVIGELRSLPVGIDETLAKTIIRGVAFHRLLPITQWEYHKRLTFSDAGLTIEERDIVAEAYDKGVIKVIVATCSLAAGINLPARRVILQGARMGRELIGPAML